ncbi:hypothetical protein GCM10022235_78890 [Kribbella ginsengisoli]|uniref:Uncharacterized protein n=2 Tax=Kribbella ginsengisoli TaxID=363865 RepID=A0ABP6Z330_9ACTN
MLASSACGSDSSTTPSPSLTASARTYTSHAFSIPLIATLPDDLKVEADPDSATLLSWDSNLAENNKVRFVLPVNVYKPKQLKPAAPPQDYLTYLRGLTAQGVTLTDEVTTTVDGHNATVMTGDAAGPLDGVLGCPEANMPADDCFGLQPDLTLRIAVIDVSGKTLLAWARAEKGAVDVATFFTEFETMLKGVKFT